MKLFLSSILLASLAPCILAAPTHKVYASFNLLVFYDTEVIDESMADIFQKANTYAMVSSLDKIAEDKSELTWDNFWAGYGPNMMFMGFMMPKKLKPLETPLCSKEGVSVGDVVATGYFTQDAPDSMELTELVQYSNAKIIDSVTSDTLGSWYKHGQCLLDATCFNDEYSIGIVHLSKDANGALVVSQYRYFFQPVPGTPYDMPQTGALELTKTAEVECYLDMDVYTQVKSSIEAKLVASPDAVAQNTETSSIPDKAEVNVSPFTAASLTKENCVETAGLSSVPSASPAKPFLLMAAAALAFMVQY